MRKLIFILLFLVPIISSAQEDAGKPDFAKASKELQRFSSKSTTGILLQLAGATSIAVGIHQSAGNRKETAVPYVIGGALFLGGIVTHVGAFTHTNRAALYLSAEGVNYRIKSKHEK